MLTHVVDVLVLLRRRRVSSTNTFFFHSRLMFRWGWLWLTIVGVIITEVLTNMFVVAHKSLTLAFALTRRIIRCFLGFASVTTAGLGAEARAGVICVFFDKSDIFAARCF